MLHQFALQESRDLASQPMRRDDVNVSMTSLIAKINLKKIKMADGKLIILVQGFSVVYSQQHTEYRNNGVKEIVGKVLPTTCY